MVSPNAAHMSTHLSAHQVLIDAASVLNPGRLLLLLLLLLLLYIVVVVVFDGGGEITALLSSNMSTFYRKS